MSVQSAASSGAGTLATASASGSLAHHSSLPSLPQSDCQTGCCDSRGAISQLLNNSDQLSRGEMTGDLCLTLLLDEDTISGAVLSEADYSSTTVIKSVPAALAITPEAAQVFAVDGVDLSEPTIGVVFGTEALSRGKKSDADLLFPTRALATSADEEIALTKSSKDGSATLLCEEALALLLKHHARSIAKTIQPVAAKKKSKKPQDPPLTLVVPGYLSMTQRKSLVSGAKLAGLEVRQIFSRGLATVAGNLTVTSGGSLRAALETWMARSSNTDTEPLVLTVHTHAQGGIDVSVIRCERLSAVNAASNLMGFDRLLCLASGGAADGNDLCDEISRQLSVAGVTRVSQSHPFLSLISRRLIRSPPSSPPAPAPKTCPALCRGREQLQQQERRRSRPS
jgi:hypothetical protein